MSKKPTGKAKSKAKTPRAKRASSKAAPASDRALEKVAPQQLTPHAPVIGEEVVTLEMLSSPQKIFALEYLANGQNATAAYELAHPGVTKATANVGGWRMLRNVKVARYLLNREEAIWKSLQLGSEQALARLGMAATIDVRLLFDDKNNLLPMKDWPAEAAMLVEQVEVLEDGKTKVKFPSRLTALRTILEQSGKLRSLAGGIDELAAAIRADRAEHGEASL